MASAAVLNIDQGCTYRATITVVAGAPPLPFDLTGASAILTIAPSFGPAKWVVLNSSPGGGLTLGGTLGTIAMVVTAAQTGSIPAPVGTALGTGRFDLAVTLASGDVERVLQGTIILSPAVSLPTGPGGPQ